MTSTEYSFEVLTTRLNKVDQSLIKQIDDDSSDISRVLSLGETIDDGVNFETFLEDIEDYPLLSRLPDSIVQKCSQYAQRVFNIDIPDINDRYQSLDEHTASELFFERKVLTEQSYYLNFEESEFNCNVYFLQVYMNGCYSGGVFAFWNPIRSDVLFIQGICKSLQLHIFGLLYPEITKSIPKLNSLLDISLQSLARELGADKIQVMPIGQQKEYLKKYYGYKFVSGIYYPSKMIVGYDNIFPASRENLKGYQKPLGRFRLKNILKSSMD